MPYVRVKQKYQVTIPVSVRDELDLHEGDTLEAVSQDGRIILTPQIITDRNHNTKSASLLSLKGKNQGSGLYKNADDADEYISQLREEWR